MYHTQEQLRSMEENCKRMLTVEDRQTLAQEKQAAGRAFDGEYPGARWVNRVRAVTRR